MSHPKRVTISSLKHAGVINLDPYFIDVYKENHNESYDKNCKLYATYDGKNLISFDNYLRDAEELLRNGAEVPFPIINAIADKTKTKRLLKEKLVNSPYYLVYLKIYRKYLNYQFYYDSKQKTDIDVLIVDYLSQTDTGFMQALISVAHTLNQKQKETIFEKASETQKLKLVAKDSYFQIFALLNNPSEAIKRKILQNISNVDKNNICWQLINDSSLEVIKDIVYYGSNHHREYILKTKKPNIEIWKALVQFGNKNHKLHILNHILNNSYLSDDFKDLAKQIVSLLDNQDKHKFIIECYNLAKSKWIFECIAETGDDNIHWMFLMKESKLFEKEVYQTIKRKQANNPLMLDYMSKKFPEI